MQTLPIHLFKDSFGPFVQLLNENNVKYQMREARADVVMAASGVVEVLQALGTAAMWGALATVIVAFINSRRGRTVIITTKDHTVVRAEGLSMSELEHVLSLAQSLTAIDPGKGNEAGESNDE